MRRATIKTAGILFCSLTLVLTGTSKSEAFLFGWLFGHHHCPTTAFRCPTICPPACPTICPPACPPIAPPVQTFYAPACGAPTFAPSGVTVGYAPYTVGYAPLDYGVSYAPLDYGVSYAPVDYGTSYGPIHYGAGFAPIDHGAAYGPAGSCANGTLLPPGHGELRTFGNDQPPGAPGADDSQFAPREERRRVKPAAPPDNGDYDDPDAEEKSGAARRDTLRIDDTIPDTIIPQRQPAPVKPPVEESSSDGFSERIAVRPLGLDHKITWRTTPLRTRLVRQSKVETPSIARTKADPNAGWLPASEAKVARR